MQGLIQLTSLMLDICSKFDNCRRSHVQTCFPTLTPLIVLCPLSGLHYGTFQVWLELLTRNAHVRPLWICRNQKMCFTDVLGFACANMIIFLIAQPKYGMFASPFINWTDHISVIWYGFLQFPHNNLWLLLPTFYYIIKGEFSIYNCSW